MPVSSSPWPFPLYELLLLDTPAEIGKKNAENRGQKAPKKKEGRGKGKEREGAKNSKKGNGGKYSRGLVTFPNQMEKCTK